MLRGFIIIYILVSFDPVALDKACVDLVNNSATVKGSILEENEEKCACNEGKKDKFGLIYPSTDWSVGLKHAQDIKLGSMDYDLT